MSAVLSPITTLEHLILQWAVEKYIEAAGTSAQILERAQTIKTIATQIDGVALGTTSLSQLQTLTTADLASKNISVSTQTLITGLVNVVTAVLPAQGGILAATQGAIANVFLNDVITACSKFGA